MSRQCQELKGKLNQGVLKMYPDLQEKEVIPTTEVQEILPDDNIYGLSKVTVDKINIESKTVKSTQEEQTVLPTEGNYISEINVEPIILQEKEVKPSGKQQEITADIGFDGLGKVIVDATEDVEGETITVKSTKEKQTIIPEKGILYDKVIVDEIVLEDKEIMPQIYEQEIETSNLFDGLGKVKIGAVSHEIDSNIIPTNIRKGKTILGVEGNLEEDKPDQEKTVDPAKEVQEIYADTGFELAKVTVNGIKTETTSVKSTKETQIITPTLEDSFIEQIEVQPLVLENINVTPTTVEQTIETEYDGIEKVIVNPVTSDIDENIIAENILQGKTILGVEGNVVEREPIDEELTLQEETIAELMKKVQGKAGISTNDVLPDGTKFRTSTFIIFPTFDTSEMTDMSNMFNSCKQVTEINTSKFNTNNVRDMQYMFNDCNVLKNLDTSKFNTDSVTDMKYMFYHCYELENINVSNFNVENVTTLKGMFAGCSSITELNVSNFNTTKVADFNNIFYGCTNLTNIDLSNWDLFGVRSKSTISNMFTGCTSLSDDSLNSILKMFDTYIHYDTSYKTLKYIGLTQEQANRCTTLSNWQALVGKNWTTGY